MRFGDRKSDSRSGHGADQFLNAASKVFLRAILDTDSTLSEVEQAEVCRLLDGEKPQMGLNDPLLVTQKTAAELLGISRVTLWRLTRKQLLHRVEILPGTFRYKYKDLIEFVSCCEPRRLET